MTQIIEFTKHSDKYLIHHFDFECNDSVTIGTFTGNCSLNKFMSLHDWHQIFNDLAEPVTNYVKNPTIKSATSKRKIIDTNFELSIAWLEVDTAFYSKLLRSIDFNFVFPYVIKVNVSLCSNIDKFVADVPIKSSSIRQTTADRKKTSKCSANESQVVITNGVLDESIQLKECCVRLPLLEFDDNGHVIQGFGRNKRKYSSIASDDVPPVKISPNRSHGKNVLKFMCTSSSTPYVRNIDVALKQIEGDVRGAFGKTAKRSTNRLTTTPRSTGGFNPRIRLLTMPESVSKSESSMKIRRKNTTGKKATKANRKGKTASTKSKVRLKSKVRSVSNESELFESPTENRKVKRNLKSEKRKATPKATPQSTPQASVVVKLEECDLKSITDDELWKSFDEHYEIIFEIFSNYLKQTDETVQKAGDYNNFDVISLLTTDQFDVMLDILFDKLVKIGEFSEIDYSALFLELLIPEWVLAIFMKQLSVDRKTAIERIIAQRANQNQSYDDFATMISVRLEDTLNGTRISRL